MPSTFADTQQYGALAPGFQTATSRAPLIPAQTKAARDEALEWQLVTTLYNQTPPLLVGAFGLCLVALFGWWDTGQTWFLDLGVATLVLLTGRLFLERAFRLRREGPNRAAIWQGRFVIGAWAMGIVWGCVALVVTTNVPPLLQMIVLSGMMVIVMGAAARNAGSFVAAAGQILFGLVPTFIACAASHERYHVAFCFIILLIGFAAFSLTGHIRGQLVSLMTLNAENVALVDKVRRANVELSAAATTDALTGIANRRYFDAVLSDEAKRAQRGRTELGLLLLDIDCFKEFNDKYGHPAGDRCLLLVAKAVEATLGRPADFVARYGGEEFVAVLPQTSLSAAAALAENVRARIETMNLPHATGVKGVVTVSIGVASYSPSFELEPHQLVRAADVALYAAKSAGRNCVRVANDTLPAYGAA